MPGPGFNLTLGEVENILDHFIQHRGHPRGYSIFRGGSRRSILTLFPMMRAAMARDIRHIMINTNGKRIANDDEFLAELAEIRPAIYFQFDGFDSETYRIIRNEADILA